jgi:hypothetical protein
MEDSPMNNSRFSIVYLTLAAIGGCFTLLFGMPVSALPENGAASAQYPKSISAINSPELKAIAALEQQYFHRTFDVDMPNKRMKRLELFLTGDSNSGSIPERLAELKDYINRKRPQKAVHAEKSQLQAIAKLEQLVLKKTNPKLDANARLSAIEKKVFGNSFASLPADERIARLQKTMGIGDEDIAQAPLAPHMQDGMPSLEWPNGMISPFAGPGDMGMGMDPSRIGEIFDQLNRQLRQLKPQPGLPQGRGPIFTIPDDGFEFDQKIPGRPMPIPNGLRERNNQGLPPYMDPNSI